MREINIILLLLFTFKNFSQQRIFSYQPTKNDSLIAFLDKKNEDRISRLSINHKKDIKKILNERNEAFKKGIKDSNYIFNKDVNYYLKSILGKIYVANPSIKYKDFYFFINKLPIPNAACYGNGIFTVNLGLFDFIETDDELAFILCHELAHFILEHNDKSLVAYLDKINSKEFKKEINNLKKIEYGRRKAFSDLFTDMNYHFLRHSRNSEIEADKLGFELFEKTIFNKNAAITALNKLGTIDESVFNEKIDLIRHFNFKNYPFKESWLQKEETLFDIKEVADDYALNKDSLKTHPDIPKRIEIINQILKEKKIAKSNNSLTLDKIKSLISKINIETLLDDNKLDIALYQSLILYDKKKITEEHFYSLLAFIIKKTYTAKVNHTFGKHVEQISPFSKEENLNIIKTFLNNIEIKNIRKIGLNLCIEKEEIMKNDKDFQEIKSFFIDLNKNN
ncbi:M48 family metallopeptidase [Flavobacterium oreochromis]|uniref:M48 family metallopeptidase n=1 Tax=Flavobacterium oreochromis TaxID=2906078 RepID=A0ABW8P5B3_9FLAO|nr:M48 family metallopeptidase [Flavobacterium oreochromis]